MISHARGRKSNQLVSPKINITLFLSNSLPPISIVNTSIVLTYDVILGATYKLTKLYMIQFDGAVPT